MKRTNLFIFTVVLLLAGAGIFLYAKKHQTNDSLFISYIADTKSQDIQLYWKNDKNENFKSIQNLKHWLEKNKKKLVFAMNGGMYKKDYSPQGLYIEKQKTLSPLDTSRGKGNFYLHPNGIFYITTNNTAAICPASDFKDNGDIKYATQSGPMLVINGEINPLFKADSKNLNIRNGVGILPDNKVVFVLSKKGVSFFDMASYFKSMGCKNALYLDGFVSRAYLPEKDWLQIDGDFGVMIGVSTSAN